MTDFNLAVRSELVDGAIIHPSLPMSFLGEIIDLPDGGKTAAFTYNFNTILSYVDPFFVLAGATRAFYYNITGSGNSFTLECERAFSYTEGKYKFYLGEKTTNAITLPMFVDAKLYVGGTRG